MVNYIIVFLNDEHEGKAGWMSRLLYFKLIINDISMKTVTTARPIISIQDIQSLVEKRYALKKFACKLYRSTLNYIYLLEDSTSRYIFKLRHDDSTDWEELKGEIDC